MAIQRPTEFKGRKRGFTETENDRVSWLDEITKEKRTTKELIALIISNIEAEPAYYRNMNWICDDLSKVMKFFYRYQNVKILPFGSSITGLALRGSDVDIFLDFGGHLPEPPLRLVKSLKNKVRKYGFFTRSIPIFARIPIVQCVHRSQISCDISFLNALGVSNSNLIKFLLSIDERIRPLILILKFLMKNHGLLGQNAFTSFALIILIVFFLQSIENPIIPSICHIQNLATKREIVADWDSSFTTDKSSLPPVNNQLSVVELLYKFFEFYSTFEFGFYIISPFTGKSYLKPVFSSPDSVPQEFHLYKENLAKNESFKFDSNKFLCVQGPFNLGNNITRNVNQKCLIQFQNFCWANTLTGKEFLDQDNTEENRQKYLISLFDLDEEEYKNKKQRMESVVIYVGEILDVTDSSCTEESIRNEWSKHIFDTVLDILRGVLKCDLNLPSTNSENDSFTSGGEKLIQCEMFHHELVSKLRNDVKKDFDFPSDMSLVKKEEMISDYLCDTLLHNVKKVSLKFDAICRVNKNPTCFCIDFKSKETQKSNNHFVHQIFNFIQSNFPKWVK